jgi:hypothetical protein
VLDDLEWVPDDGISLTLVEVKRVLVALRSLIAGTDRLEPNRAYAVEIAVVIAEALERQEGDS